MIGKVDTLAAWLDTFGTPKTVTDYLVALSVVQAAVAARSKTHTCALHASKGIFSINPVLAQSVL